MKNNKKLKNIQIFFSLTALILSITLFILSKTNYDISDSNLAWILLSTIMFAAILSGFWALMDFINERKALKAKKESIDYKNELRDKMGITIVQPKGNSVSQDTMLLNTSPLASPLKEGKETATDSNYSDNNKWNYEKGDTIKAFVESEKSKDILELMIENMGEIKEYFIISKSHAKKSFTLSVALAIVGIIFFVGAAILGFITGQITEAILTAAGGGIIEIISIFALKIHKTSQEQLNHYYKALHENEEYLSTVHIVSKLSEEKQDEAYMEIIRSSLKK